MDLFKIIINIQVNKRLFQKISNNIWDAYSLTLVIIPCFETVSFIVLHQKVCGPYDNVINSSVVITLANTDCNDAINTL
jgi:hypothetical protein